MNKEFIPYEQALELKELGFDEWCIAEYDASDYAAHYGDVMLEYCRQVTNLDSDGDSCTAPLYQQAFRWFREKYDSFLLNDYGRLPHFTIIQNLMLENQNMTYEEAELACLKKLIEIVKNK